MKNKGLIIGIVSVVILLIAVVVGFSIKKKKDAAKNKSNTNPTKAAGEKTTPNASVTVVTTPATDTIKAAEVDSTKTDVATMALSRTFGKN